MTRDLSPWAEVVTVVSEAVASDYPDVDGGGIRMILLTYVEWYPTVITRPEDPGVTELLICLADRFAQTIRTNQLSQSVQYSYRRSDINLIVETATDNRRKWYDGWVPEDANSLKPHADPLDLASDVYWALEQGGNPSVLLNNYRGKR